MTLDKLIEKLRGMPAEGKLSVENVLARLLEVKAAARVRSGRPPEWGKCGPGLAGFPCGCAGGGKLLLKATTGVNGDGKYARYRECDRCGRKVRTVEVIMDMVGMDLGVRTERTERTEEVMDLAGVGT
jgi:hypothetical protein